MLRRRLLPRPVAPAAPRSLVLEEGLMPCLIWGTGASGADSHVTFYATPLATGLVPRSSLPSSYEKWDMFAYLQQHIFKRKLGCVWY